MKQTDEPAGFLGPLSGAVGRETSDSEIKLSALVTSDDLHGGGAHESIVPSQ